jgi:hypothetical protein
MGFAQLGVTFQPHHHYYGMVGDAFNQPKTTLAVALDNQVRKLKVQGYLFTKLLKNKLDYHKFHTSNVPFSSKIPKLVLTEV